MGTPTFLTHWGRVTHICDSELTIIGSDNGLSPDRRQAIIWTNAGILSFGPLRTNFSEIQIETLTFSSKKMRLKLSSAKGWPFCLGLNVLRGHHWQSLCTAITAGSLPSVRAVQGVCERVYRRPCTGPRLYRKAGWDIVNIDQSSLSH